MSELCISIGFPKKKSSYIRGMNPVGQCNSSGIHGIELEAAFALELQHKEYIGGCIYLGAGASAKATPRLYVRHVGVGVVATPAQTTGSIPRSLSFASASSGRKPSSKRASEIEERRPRIRECGGDAAAATTTTTTTTTNGYVAAPPRVLPRRRAVRCSYDVTEHEEVVVWISLSSRKHLSSPRSGSTRERVAAIPTREIDRRPAVTLAQRSTPWSIGTAARDARTTRWRTRRAPALR